jgi:hypothetical protein
MLGLGVVNLGTAPVLSDAWVLNTDAYQLIGRKYLWVDASTWADAQVWKD